MIEFHVPGVPATKGSWRPIKLKSGKVFMKPDAPRYGSWTADVKSAAMAAGVKCQETGTLQMTLTFFMQRPKDHYRKSGGVPLVKITAPNFHGKKPDGDKLERCIMDALTGIAYKDDSQVAVLKWEKRYPLDTRLHGVRIEIKPLEVPHAAVR